MIAKEVRENNERLEDILNCLPKDLLMFATSCFIEAIFEKTSERIAKEITSLALKKFDRKEPYNGKWNVLEKYENLNE